MASVSISHMVLFIASIVVAASVVGVFTDSISRVSGAIDQRGISISEDVRTDIEIISDSGSDNIHTDPDITIHIKNTGSRSLTAEAKQMDVFVNGTYNSDVTVSLLGGESTWKPGAVAKVTITVGSLDSGEHRVKVIINKDEELFTFNK